MAKVIPAVLAKNFQELKFQLKTASNFADWVHVDVMDGNFVPNVTWRNPDQADFKSLPVKTELHLMIKNPGLELDLWLDSGAKRIIFHIEAIDFPERPKAVFDIIKKCSISEKQVGIALNPITPINQIEPFLPVLDLVQVMGVEPGFSGQTFQEKILDKIKNLRSKNQDILISVDGGIDERSAPVAASAGADILISHSFIFESPDPRKAFERLCELG